MSKTPLPLQQKIDNTPATPGVYLFIGVRGDILYVGKAKALRSRVRSYFQNSAVLDPAKQQMVKKIANIETISTDNETEALVLEANLIRQHQPPYNVVLRDDKYYLFIKITKEELPRVFVTRRIKRDSARYFGPYSSARSVRATLKLLRRIFPYRSEKDSPRDTIFPHPLFANKNETDSRHTDYNLSPKTYNLNINNIIRFLSGQRKEIIEQLRQGMKQASQAKQYEQAAIFRDQLQAIERLEGNQKVYLPRKESFDIISLAREKNTSAANVFQIRQGKLLGKQTFLLKHRATASPEDTLRQFLLQYYGVAQDIPKTIFVPHQLEDSEAITNWISKHNPPALAVPKRGKKKQLMEMGATNASQLLTEQQAEFEREHRAEAAMKELFKVTGISPGAPTGRRIETYDISNIQGQLATASMVVFIDGQPRRSQYRKFRMKISGTPNDFAMLQETLSRRFANRNKDWPMPDMVIIDGGKGQLSSAKKILDQLNLNIPIISIAKREEEIFIPGKPEPVHLPHTSDALYLIQRMRDEAHRFTITYHRLLRSKKQRRSILDEVPGIGPKTKKKLLTRFGSLKNIRAASDKELNKVISASQLEALRDYL